MKAARADAAPPVEFRRLALLIAYRACYTLAISPVQF